MIIDKSSFKEIKIPCLDAKSYSVNLSELKILFKDNNITYSEESYEQLLNEGWHNIRQEILRIIFGNNNFKHYKKYPYEALANEIITDVYENISDGSIVVLESWSVILLDNMELFDLAFIRNGTEYFFHNAYGAFTSYIKDKVFLEHFLSNQTYQKICTSRENHYILNFEDGRVLETTEYLNKITSAHLYNNLEDYNNHEAYIQHLCDLADEMG